MSKINNNKGLKNNSGWKKKRKENVEIGARRTLKLAEEPIKTLKPAEKAENVHVWNLKQCLK